jgi:hypothetical protein
LLKHLTGLLEFTTNEQDSKNVVETLKEGGKKTLDRGVQPMCEPVKGYIEGVPSSLRCASFHSIFIT